MKCWHSRWRRASTQWWPENPEHKKHGMHTRFRASCAFCVRFPVVSSRNEVSGNAVSCSEDSRTHACSGSIGVALSDSAPHLASSILSCTDDGSPKASTQGIACDLAYLHL